MTGYWSAMQRRRLQNSFESEAFLLEWFRTGFNRETCALIPVDSNITAHVLRGTDKCDICILAWLLNEMNISAYVTGAVQPKLSQKNLRSIELELPTTGNQRAILHLLNPISEKIQLNQRTNDYLAELIRLEFDKRFGKEMPTTDLGDVMSISIQSIKPTDHIGEIWEHYSIPAYDEAHRPIFESADRIKSNKYVIDGDCILVSKLNPSTKRLWLPRCTSKIPVCSTELIVYRPKEVKYKSFYYAVIDSETFSTFLLSYVTGSTGSCQRSQPKAMLKYPIPNPGAQKIEDSCKFTKSVNCSVAKQ